MRRLWLVSRFWCNIKLIFICRCYEVLGFACVVELVLHFSVFILACTR
jgi:hypothetical protein